MFKVYDFRCTNGHVFEEFVQPDVTTSRCGCGANAKRLVSAPSFHLDGASGDFPGQHMKWVREHEKAGRNKKKDA
jgi:predicted nucleic acid-binding Zn ribbon protein